MLALKPAAMTSCEETGNAAVVGDADGADEAAGDGDATAASMLLPLPPLELPPPPQAARAAVSVASEMSPNVRTGSHAP
jgi:hypothetical protein